MYGSPYRVVLILGKLADLSMSAFDPPTNTWADAVPLSRKPDPNFSPATTDPPALRGNNNEHDDEDAADDDDDGTVFYLTKSGTVMSSTTQRSPSQEHSCAVTCHPNGSNPVAYFLSSTGAVVTCDLASRTFSELPRILPVHAEHSIDVVACGGRAYAVVLTEYLDTASLRVWEFAEGAWAQAAAMPPAMSHGFYGAKADVNCVGHGGRIMVCVSSGEANGSFLCDVGSNRWEELPRCVDAGGDGGVTDFVAAFSFEPRMEVAV
ncbi:hypothetical protein QYE76_039679 [Lolium multiflorum]|uniref:Uncharacterized protein n=1 Tax=Lolium multiflorum TaxID=4521 RepID=A0AAD8TAB3_LOLMU|nr:hypothetical protein QYE76_039679 [Lolium multiflorum]